MARTRLRPRWRDCAGFTLIELMVALIILVLIGAIAFAGMRQNDVKGQTRRFVDDIEGLVMQAHNRAIDDQTRVRLTLGPSSAAVTAFNPVTDTFDLVDRVEMLDQTSALLTQQVAASTQRVCIYGLTSGVQAPAQSVDVSPPSDCLAGQQVIQFEPDGSFTDPNGDFTTVANAGATLWIGDRSLSSGVRLTMVQIFPGGLIRSFEEIRQ